jgi:hypothetical protein
MNDGEFREYIFTIKNNGFIVGEIMTFTAYSLKFASVTDKGLALLTDHSRYDSEYPDFKELPNWVRKNIME